MCLLRDEFGGLILCFGPFSVERVVGVGVFGVVSSLFLAFFGGFCVEMGREEWRWVCLSVVVVVRFRVVGMVGVRVGSDMSLEVGWVCLLRRERVREAGCGVVVRLCMRSFTNVSSSPVSMYFRWDLDNASACCWVCVRVGMRPWYIVARFTRSMCIPHVQPLVCWGLLCTWVSGFCFRRSEGAISSPVYHWRRVVCILSMA